VSAESYFCEPKTAAADTPLPFREYAVLGDQIVVLRDCRSILPLPLFTTGSGYFLPQRFFQGS
jgi:hypothetical protein